MAKLTGNVALAERGDRTLNIIINVLLVTFSVIIMYPLWFVLIASVSSPAAINAGKVIFWPVEFTWAGYTDMFNNELLWTGYANTLIYAVIGTVWSLLKNVPAAYALSRRDLPGRKWITMFIMLTMYFGGGMVPTFVLISNIGWYGSPAAILFTSGMSAYYVVLTRSYFMSNISDSLFDAARIDGCGYTRFFLKVVLPLSGSIIAILVLFSVQGYWNEYLNAQMYLPDRKYWTLQQAVRIITSNATTAQLPENATQEEYEAFEEAMRKKMLIKYSVVIVSAIPMIIIYPFVQKHFVKGVMVGAVKG